MRLSPTKLEGCYRIDPRVFRDCRGTFVKTFHRETFTAMGLAADFPEQFHSLSHKNVLRGLHFQRPPHDHAKIVTCVSGCIADVMLDLRRGSPTYGEHVMLRLIEDEMVYAAPGIAHGFYVLSETALVSYAVTTQHSPEHDAGIRWDSAGIKWPGAPIVSMRDAGFPQFAEFESPFRMAS